MQGIYPIQSVSLRTGLSSHVIRAWERRYGVVTPARVEGRRLYSEADVVRLSLLKRAVDAGSRIGMVANLDTDQLRTILSADTQDTQSRELSDRVARAVSHARATDVRKLDAELYDAVRTFGDRAVIDAFIFPLLRELGTRWREGRAEIAEEHIATSVIRGYLSSRLRDLAPPADAPMVVIAALEGEHHDIGCLAGSVRAQEHGWQATFLGANTPPDSIAHVVSKTGARAVVAVVTMEESEASVAAQLERLAAGVPPATALALAGEPSESTRRLARDAGFTVLQTMTELDRYIESLSESSPPDGR